MDVAAAPVGSENNSPALCYEFMQQAGIPVSMEKCAICPEERRKAAIDWAIDVTTPFAPQTKRPDLAPLVPPDCSGSA